MKLTKLQSLLPYLLFAILVCLFLWRPIFRGDALLPGDYLAQMAPWNSVVAAPDPAPQWNPLQWDAIAQFYPWRVFYARSMSAGHIPLWNPHQFCGTPFLANGQSAVLYPLNLIFLVFAPITAFTVFAALHLWLAQAFMYGLLRELGLRILGAVVGAVCFAFSAFMVLWLELPTLVSVAVWLPAVLLMIYRAVERRSVFSGSLAGAALAMSFLAGHLQIAFYVALAALLWWGWRLVGVWRAEGRGLATRRLLLPFGAFIAIAALVPSAQLLPSMELGRSSHRVRPATGEGYASFVANAVEPYRLVTAYAPDYYGNPSKGDFYALGQIEGSPHVCTPADYMEYGLYAGVLPLLLATAGFGLVRKRKHCGFFAFLSVVSLLIAVGSAVNVPFYYLIPGFSAFGGPNRVLILYLFGVAALAGIGADYLADSDEASWKLKSRLAGIAVGVQVLLFLASNYIAKTQAISHFIGYTITDESAPAAALVTLYTLSLASVVVLFVAVLRSRLQTLAPVLIVGVIVADLFAFGINYNPTCSRDKVYPDTELTDALRHIGANTRIAPINANWSLFRTPKAILPPNAALVYGLYDAQGYDSLFTREYKDISSSAQHEDSSPPENGNMVVFKHYQRDVLGLASIVLSNEPIPGLKAVGAYNGVVVSQGPPDRTAVALDSALPYEPFSFRLGLFLSLLGVAVLSAAGACLFMQCRGKRGQV